MRHVLPESGIGKHGRRLRRVLLLIVLHAAVLVAPAWSATYYVRPDGGQSCADANSGLTSALPWCTIPGTRTSSDAGWLNAAWGGVTRAAPIQCGDSLVLCGGTTHGRNANGQNDVGGIRLDDGSNRGGTPDVPLEGFYTRGCPAVAPITLRLATSGDWPGTPSCEAGSFVIDGTGITTPGATFFGDVHALVGIQDIDTLHILGASPTRQIVVQNAQAGAGFSWANGIVVSTEREAILRRTWLRYVRVTGHHHVGLAYGAGPPADGVRDFLFQDVVADRNGAGCFDNGINNDQSTGNGALYGTICTQSAQSVAGTGDSSEGYWGQAAGRVGSGLRVVWIIDADSFGNGMAGLDYGAILNANVTQDWILSVRNLRMWNNATRPVAVKANWRMSGDGDNTPPDVRLFVSRCLMHRPDAAGEGGVNAETGHDGGDVQWWHCVLWGGDPEIFFNRTSGDVGLYNSILERHAGPAVRSFDVGSGVILDPPWRSDNNLYRSASSDAEMLTDFEFRCTSQAGTPDCRDASDCAVGSCGHVYVAAGLTYANATAGLVSWVGPGDRTSRLANDPAFAVGAACGPPTWDFAACGNFPISAGSAAIDAGRCFFRTTNAATGGTAVAVQGTTPQLDDPRIAFYAPDSFYQPAGAGIPPDPIQVGACTTTVATLGAGAIGLSSPCTWAVGDCVHFPYQAAAPDAGYAEFGAGIGGAVCGNGNVEPGEQCDDGDLVSGDGCDANCTATGCGNAVVTAGEQCDDGNAVAGDGCEADCTLSAYALLTGRRLLVRDRAGDANRRRLSVVSRDPLIQTPAAGSAGDPTLGDGELRLGRGMAEIATMPLPRALWHGLGSPPGARGWRYRDPQRTMGPCTTVVLRRGRDLKAACKGALLPFTLDEPAQGALTVALRPGAAGTQACVHFGGDVQKDVSTAVTGSGIFRARAAPAPASCPLP